MAHDEQLDDLMRSIREAHRNRSPRAIARDERGRAFRASQDAVPERERILANARKYTYEDYVAGWRELNLIAQKPGKLTEDEKDELQRLRHKWSEDCPYNQPPEVKVSLMGEGIPHLDAWLQDWLWDHLWFAERFGQTIDEHIRRGPATDLYTDAVVAALKASPPLPDNYVPSTRRS